MVGLFQTEQEKYRLFPQTWELVGDTTTLSEGLGSRIHPSHHKMIAARTAAQTIRRTPFLAQKGSLSALGIRAYAAAEEQDLIVIGGGPGGYVGAIKAAQLGLKVTCIEGRGTLGGTCLNVGCIPSKSLLHSSHMYEEATHSFSEHGIDLDNVRLNLDKMLGAKNTSVSQLTGGIEGLFKKNKVTYLKGWGSFTSPHEVSVALNDGSSQVVKGKNIMIATGSEVMPLPNVDIDEERIISSTGALSLPAVPEKMAVIGGGVIGLELGSVWRRLGAEVHVVEFLDHIGGEMDVEVGKSFLKSLKKQGMHFNLSTKVTSCVRHGDKVKLVMEGPKKTEEKEFDVVLVSIGRRPFTEGLNLAAAGLTADKRGRIPVNADLSSTVHPHIYAIGDVIDGPMLAHKAEEEGIAVAETIVSGSGHVNYDVIPSVIYTYPEVAWVGLNEEQCKAAGTPYKVGKFPFIANSRAKSNMDTEGLVKFIAHAETDRILGVHIMNTQAGEMIAEACLAMEYGASSEDVARTCHAHPTLSEAVKEAAMATYDKPVNF